MQMTTTIPSDTFKPLWWYLLGFPIWTQVANYASQSLKQNLLSDHQHDTDDSSSSPYRAHYSPKQNDPSQQSPEEEHILDVESMVPTKQEYYMAIFFVIFGIISGVVGVISNLYIQIHKL